MKRIKLLGLIVCIALVCLIFLESTSRENNINSTQNENIGEVINNGGSVLKYNGYLYYVSAKNTEEEGFHNALYRKNLLDGKEEVLYDGGRYRIENRLIIFNNNIFFSVVGQTYYINLENPNRISEYNDGILYTIGDGKLIYVYNNTLFKAEYYLKTLAIKSISSIATLDPNYMFEDEENLYFYSNNSDNSKSIVCVNKANQTVQVLDGIEPPENTHSVYNLKLNGKNVTLYENEQEVVTILRGVDGNLNNTSIEEIEEVLYIRFELNNEEQRRIFFFEVNKDGSDLERINNII